MVPQSKRITMRKTKQTSATSAHPTVNGKKIFDIVGDIKTEFKKITWTSREELRAYTKIVVGATFAFGMSIYAVDLIIQTILASLNWIAQYI